MKNWIMKPVNYNILQNITQENKKNLAYFRGG